MNKITPVDIQHKSFKKALQGYDRADVDGFLDEIIETLEDEADVLARSLPQEQAVAIGERAVQFYEEWFDDPAGNLEKLS